MVRRRGIGVVASDSPSAFAQQTIALLSDPARRAALGLAARRVAEGSFSWEHMADRLEKVYLKDSSTPRWFYNFGSSTWESR